MSTHTADLILEGSYDTQGLEDIAKEFVQNMKNKCELDSIPDVLNVAEWGGGN